MIRIDVHPWEDAREDASRIRFEVFVQEQGVPLEIEMDARDVDCLHALAYLDGAAVGTGRLLPDGHIGRMAVLKSSRGHGVGGAMLERLVDEARRRGMRSVALAAQTHAIGFYRKHGFAALGEEFVEAGIPHQEMRRMLSS
jgi:predicted GNAT family N-acyltransferase